MVGQRKPGQGCGEQGATQRAETCLDVPAVRLGDPLGDGEAEPGAVAGAGVVEAGEALEDALPVGEIDAVTIVLDGELDLAVMLGERDAHDGVGVADGVGEEAGDHAGAVGFPAARLPGRDA